MTAPKAPTPRRDPGDACHFGDVGFATSAGDVTERGRKQARVDVSGAIVRLERGMLLKLRHRAKVSLASHLFVVELQAQRRRDGAGRHGPAGQAE